MIRKTWLLSDEEREAAELKGRIDGKREGKYEGKREGEQSVLARMIHLRFPTATPAFVKKASTPFNNAYVDEIISAIATINTLEEFKKRVRELIPAC